MIGRVISTSAIIAALWTAEFWSSKFILSTATVGDPRKIVFHICLEISGLSFSIRPESVACIVKIDLLDRCFDINTSHSLMNFSRVAIQWNIQDCSKFRIAKAKSLMISCLSFQFFVLYFQDIPFWTKNFELAWSAICLSQLRSYVSSYISRSLAEGHDIR